jgi:hypothetical protein
VIGNAILTTLNELDLAGLLKPDSRIKDLSLVMALALNCLEEMIEIGMESEVAVAWRHGVVAYAQKAGINLKEAAPFGTAETIKKLEEQLEEARTGKMPEKDESNEGFMCERQLPLDHSEVKAIKDCVSKALDPAKSDHWSWAAKVSVPIAVFNCNNADRNRSRSSKSSKRQTLAGSRSTFCG